MSRATLRAPKPRCASSTLGTSTNPDRPRACGNRLVPAAGLLLGALALGSAHALPDGASANGFTGGLVIPTAHVLPDYGMAASYGNYREPRFAAVEVPRNLTYGIGLLRHAELFGRYADYDNIPHGQYMRRGTRDLSVNVKLRFPLLPERGPQLAVGRTDAAGSARNFRTTYIVATQRWKTLSGTVGYTRSQLRDVAPYEGPFGGVE